MARVNFLGVLSCSFIPCFAIFFVWFLLKIIQYDRKSFPNAGVATGSPASSTTAEIYMQAYEYTAITTALHPPKVWEQFADDIYSILKHTHLENFFHHINNLHQKIKFTMEEESDRELVFLDTLLKQ